LAAVVLLLVVVAVVIVVVDAAVAVAVRQKVTQFLLIIFIINIQFGQNTCQSSGRRLLLPLK